MSTRNSNGMPEVLVRFWHGTSFSQRAKCRVYCPSSEWSAKDGMPSVSKRVTPQSISATACRMKLEQIRHIVYERWMTEQKTAGDGWLQSVIDDIMIRKQYINL
ncbi:MAG: hypothetical protein IKN59_01785 [Paludibacteraceae bacterium]|nr:hypothetical protein [Paludibacteraceae bacterium]